ncbi:hypothetical protein EHYA_06915 [Embleya hyalina]|uniref:Uncharacterized protein n=1 Tax=Embleya hyalina TaxID=516124 RepID=A0A401YX58_9ACTN|nr:hypothetical protein EHYA_06915 [Embleya hyalina]
MLNTSVARYVEAAWRRHAAIGIIGKVEEPAPTAAEDVLAHHDDRLYGCVELVVDAARRLDPVSGSDGSESVWIELISENEQPGPDHRRRLTRYGCRWW